MHAVYDEGSTTGKSLCVNEKITVLGDKPSMHSAELHAWKGPEKGKDRPEDSSGDLNC